MWIARDKDGLYCYKEKPIRCSRGGGYWGTNSGYYKRLRDTLFSWVTLESDPVWVRFISPDWIDSKWYLSRLK